MHLIVLQLNDCTSGSNRLAALRALERCEQPATGLNNFLLASATAKVVPRRPAPMMETSGFCFLFTSGIGIFNEQTLV